jgi:uncharacterized protein YueI
LFILNANGEDVRYYTTYRQRVLVAVTQGVSQYNDYVPCERSEHGTYTVYAICPDGTAMQ